MIRLAIIEDIDSLIELGKLMHDEGEYEYLAYSETKIKSLLLYALNSNKHICLVYVVNDKIVGLLLGYITELYFCNSLAAFDLALYIKEEFRGSIAAAKMINQFAAWAKSKDCKEVCIASSVNVNAELFTNLCERLKFRKVGSVMKRRL